jgi:redox-sensitive bicupin YhaK (pirin superfamily)
MAPVIDVRRAAERFSTRTEWLASRHSFSFGEHYDPANVGFAALVAHNDDVVAVGAGYDTHPHADTEIVTWVLEGSLVHLDSRGGAHVLGPGSVQLLSAGSGVLHSERNDAPGAARPTRFVQMWLRPDESGLPPAYAQAAVADERGLVPLVSGVRGLDAPVRIHTAGAALHVARLAPGQSVGLPDAPHVHVFVAHGRVNLAGAGRLAEGDAARCTGEGGPCVTADEPAELLVWQLNAPLAR